ncbi:conserved hypothetical protein [Kribbella flavida DSM 17836]|uniref:DUF4832 domain-containing protein n=1 Tax=Kribbella flavida (strain DSM 17836 / JCM 10339 / NBRC 14399) TaxID=479435 RepID=D2PWK4_KRIFD|nr:DUF4832 domain-containing protein [Kribbella flavida]ADB33473.1 conserved hypothetical protein [Kribbella flavida DSM 17836]
MKRPIVLRPVVKRLGTAIALLGLALPTQAAVADDNGLTSTRNYTPSSEVIANPERGFYHHTETHYRPDGSGYVPLDQTTLRTFRTQENITQILRVFYLEKFAGQDTIDKAYLDKVRADFRILRAAGVKAIVRFAYAKPPSWPPTTPYGDAPLARVLKHIDQLTPILRQNAAVIELVQQGFIGLWGEGYYTDHFSDPTDPSVVTDQNWADRRAVTDALLRALPRDRTIQVRTPYMKQRMFGVPTGAAGALSASQAYDGSPVARVGHHNDCFLASPDDFGTYLSDPVELDKDFVAQESRYLPQGGETCAVNSPRSDWPSASEEMARLHFSYLNIDYHQDVLASWGDNITTAKKQLGYRFALVRGTFTHTTRPRGDVSISLDIRNDGWAAPYNPRKVRLIFQGDRHSHTVTLRADPRRWASGTTTTLTQKVRAPAVPGRYRLLLEIADPRLPNRPEYSVRLANQGVWQEATGYNDLAQTVTVGR